RSRGAGARRVGNHRRYGARRLLRARTRCAHLRRPRRGAQDLGGQENPGEVSAVIDQTGAVRAGEELDVERLRGWLERELDARGAIEIEQFPGGHSNLTYLVRVGQGEYVLRRPPFGSKVKSAHDMGREFRILSRLAPVWSKAPRPAAFCEDESVIGAKFYLMERRRGVILRKEMPAGVTIDPRAVAFAIVDTLVELHAIDWRAVGLGDFANPDGYLQRQVGG